MLDMKTLNNFKYEYVAASQTAQVLGASTNGSIGDFIHRLIVTVTTSGANGTVALLDGTTSYAIVPASTPLGVHSIELNMKSTVGGWKVTTGSAATAIGVGVFT